MNTRESILKNAVEMAASNLGRDLSPVEVAVIEMAVEGFLKRCQRSASTPQFVH